MPNRTNASNATSLVRAKRRYDGIGYAYPWRGHRRATIRRLHFTPSVEEFNISISTSPIFCEFWFVYRANGVSFRTLPRENLKSDSLKTLGEYQGRSPLPKKPKKIWPRPLGAGLEGIEGEILGSIFSETVKAVDMNLGENTGTKIPYWSPKFVMDRLINGFLANNTKLKPRFKLLHFPTIKFHET